MKKLYLFVDWHISTTNLERPMPAGVPTNLRFHTQHSIKESPNAQAADIYRVQNMRQVGLDGQRFSKKEVSSHLKIF